MTALTFPRAFGLSNREGEGVRCDAGGAFIGDAALLEHSDIGWSPRDNGELSKALSDIYGLPVDVSNKRGALAAIAKALNEGDVARAQIATLLSKLPNPPALAKGAVPEEEIVRLAVLLAEAGLLKYNPNHYPAGAPDDQGGEFAPKGNSAASVTAANGSKTKSSRDKLAGIARSSRGSWDYLRFRSHGDVPAGPDKCNIAVADWIEQAGLGRPQVSYTGWESFLPITRAPTAHEWADPSVSIPGWSAPMSVAEAQPGDVIAEAHGNSAGHVGIVVGPHETASASDLTDPSGIVVINDWGFRPSGQPPYGNGETNPSEHVVVRRYIGDQ